MMATVLMLHRPAAMRRGGPDPSDQRRLAAAAREALDAFAQSLAHDDYMRLACEALSRCLASKEAGS